jgi:hypothetical protein
MAKRSGHAVNEAWRADVNVRRWAWAVPSGTMEPISPSLTRLGFLTTSSGGGQPRPIAKIASIIRR